MRKMTKMAVTLAAMSAMTVAAASMAFAAEDGWSGDDNNGWSYTKDGAKVTGWNQINGVWYYFDKSGDMAQNELVYIQGETYFFNVDGSLMANGWVGFEKDDDVLYDYDLDIDENIADIQNKVFKNAEDAYETVWMYFNSDGTAKDDEWYQAESGLWYHFDDVIMVCGDFDHEIGNARYGFDENGAMLVGWAQNYVDKNMTAPNTNEKTWYYYDSNGKKFDANDNNGYAWKKIDGNWYCFNAVDAGQYADSVGTLVVKAFFNNKQAANGDSNFYYVDKNGVMATGVTTVDKGAAYVDATYDWADEKKVSGFVSANWDVYFNNDGEAQADKWTGNRFYAGAGTAKVQNFDTDDFALKAYADNSVAVTGNKANDKTAADIKGALVKNAFISIDSNVYYVDKYGDKVTSSVIQVGFVNATKNADGDYVDAGVLYADKDVAEAALNAGEIVCKAYVVLDGKGVAYDDVDAGRTVSAGAKKYVSTGAAYKDADNNDMDAQVFYYYNKN